MILIRSDPFECAGRVRREFGRRVRDIAIDLEHPLRESSELVEGAWAESGDASHRLHQQGELLLDLIVEYLSIVVAVNPDGRRAALHANQSMVWIRS